MAGFAESPICRRAVLLGYFGEEHPGSCGKCDRCLAPVASVDGTSDLRQAFATVLATGSSYGANHLIDVLLGRRTEKIEMAGHCDVKTFGAGVLHSRDRWRSLFRQALTGGLLETNHARGGAPGLTRSEEHTSELQSLMRLPYAVSCLKK